MMGTQYHVREELRKAIDSLPQEAQFNVVFFNDATFPYSQAGVVPATPQNKLGALEFARTISSVSSGDILPAAERAFAQRPSVIYILTDEVNDLERLRLGLRRLNLSKSVMVNVLLFRNVQDPEQMSELGDVLRENNGVVYSAVLP